MRKLLILLILAVSGILGAALSIFAFHEYNVFDVKGTLMQVSVTEDGTVGFNLGTDKMYFGQVPRGLKSTRKFSVANGDGREVRIQIKVDGDMAPWVTVGDNFFTLRPGQSRELDAFIKVPADAPVGEYTGELLVYFLRP